MKVVIISSVQTAAWQGEKVIKDCSVNSCSSSCLTCVSVGSLKPRFYNLGPADATTQDLPKIDGLVRAMCRHSVCHVLVWSGTVCNVQTLSLSCVGLVSNLVQCADTQFVMCWSGQ